MSYRNKFLKGPDWKESDGNKHGVEIIGMDIKKYKRAIIKIDQLEIELKDARECNKVKDKYWDQTRIDRNTYLIEKQILERKVEELETELYFCNRNKRIGDTVEGVCDEEE